MHCEKIFDAMRADFPDFPRTQAINVELPVLSFDIFCDLISSAPSYPPKIAENDHFFLKGKF